MFSRTSAEVRRGAYTTAATARSATTAPRIRLTSASARACSVTRSAATSLSGSGGTGRNT